MKRTLLLSIITFLVVLFSLSTAAVTRLYVGDIDGQFMAGIDSRVEFGPFFVGGDVRTIIRKTLVNEEETVVGFLPDRTDYKTFFGLAINNFEIEYAHTCYHRVISNTDVAFYTGNVNLANTDTLSLKWYF